jgi:hypothetical protein
MLIDGRRKMNKKAIVGVVCGMLAILLLEVYAVVAWA